MSPSADEGFVPSNGEEGHQDKSIADEEHSLRGFEEESEEGESLDDSTDIDEYASFFTDYEKYQFDQARWGGTSNTRKSHIAKKQRKDNEEVQDQENSAQTDTSKDQDGSKTLSKPRRRGKNQPDVPSDETEIVIIEEGIHFDASGNLWYTHWIGSLFLCERATFHHWVRPGLSQVENAKGTYDFPRQRGIGSWDTTCYNAIQEHWGLERSHYAPIMFEWERLNSEDPVYQLESLYYQGLLVIDYRETPVRNFREIPIVISSAFEGGFMEPATRLHSKIAYEDIRARMPPFIQVKMRGQTTTKALPKANTLSGRSRRFRESAGAISWYGREGSDNIKSFIEDIVKPVLNSTLGSRDLTKEELDRLRLINHGTKPSRAKVGTTQESKDKYIADTYKAAGLAPTTGLPQDAENLIEDTQVVEEKVEEAMEPEVDVHQEFSGSGWEANLLLDYDTLYDDEEDGFVDNPLASAEKERK